MFETVEVFAVRRLGPFPLLVSLLTVPALALSCVATDLSVPATHPGNPGAPVAPLAFATPLRSALVAEPPSPSDNDAMTAHPHDHHHAPDASTAAMHEDTPGMGPQQNEPAQAMTTASAASAPTPMDSKPAATVFTCVMHPQIASDKPGNCPICGMKLVPKKAAK